MRILLIEPYYTGSHKAWADGYKKYSKNEIELLTLEGRHWKWRMHGGAIELAQIINERYKSLTPPDMMLISDMLDLTTLKSLLESNLRSIPTAFYFHENQLSYPYTENDTDSKRVRDFHYGFINYTSALASDKVFFNSKSQMNSFFEALSCSGGCEFSFWRVPTEDSVRLKRSAAFRVREVRALLGRLLSRDSRVDFGRKGG